MGKLRTPPASGAAVTPYSIDNTGESNRIALWDFTETSGNLVDSINGMELVPTGVNIALQKHSSPGPEGYENGLYANIYPGYLVNNLNNTTYIVNTDAGDNATLSPGTGDFTLELWCGGSGTSAEAYLWSGSKVDASSYISLTYRPRSNDVRCYIRATDGTTLFLNGTGAALSQPLYGIGPYKFRLDLDRDGNVTLKVNGETSLTSSASTLVGKTITFERFTVLSNDAGAGGMPGNTAYACRITHLAGNNAGGPNGG